MPAKPVILSRPKDGSLEAHKAWLREIFKHITGKEGDDDSMTEEKWRQSWQAFWNKTGESPKP